MLSSVMLNFLYTLLEYMNFFFKIRDSVFFYEKYLIQINAFEIPVKVNDYITKEYQITAGARQGSKRAHKS